MLVLTPNRRSAAFLIRQHNEAQIAAGKHSWITPEIMSLESWIAQLWQLCLENSMQKPLPLLNKLQQQILWEKIIQNSSVGVELLRIAPTAKSALQAWKFLRQWQVSVNKLEAYAEYSADTAAFYTWLQSYLKWLEDNQYLDSDLMIDHLTQHIPEFINKLPQKICLLGVDDLAPQYATLFKALETNGVNITHESMLVPGATIVQHGFADSETELHAAASWAAEILEKETQQIIAVVVPNLELYRRDVVRIFNSMIPQNLMNISAPMSLADYTLIDIGLLILQLCKPVINYEDFSILLRSPYIVGAETEQNLRACIDRALREKVEAKLTWHTLRARLANYDTCLLNVIDNMQGILSTINNQHTNNEWVPIFTRILSCWSWPGERGVTTEESDLISCWSDVLHNYCQLAVVGNAHNISAALQLLQRIALETPFLPAETGTTRLHVLGVLEAAGIAFDQLWITGMDRDSWPPDSAPNPFIPAELQRQVDMPRSSPQRELKVARRLTNTLKLGGKSAVHFSYAKSIDDHATGASNLIVGIPEEDYKARDVVAKKIFSVELETLIDVQAPHVSDPTLRGGASALKLQALCPFKAFAEIRLKAKCLEEPLTILNSAERGTLVHDVLEKFWQQCRSQEQLFSWLPATLETMLLDIVSNVLAQWQKRYPLTLDMNYMALEKIRLQSLIKRWLLLELERAPFVVKELEQKLMITIGPLRVSVRMDRLDQFADGSVAVIDYKTGIAKTSDWFSDPILEPQLPLYALNVNNTLAAVVFANVKPQYDGLKFSGVSHETGLFPNVREHVEWDNMLTTWRESLMQAANDFAAGVAVVQPHSPQVCKKCNLQALCRIYDN